MEIIDRSHKKDYVLEYYMVAILSILTFKKISKLERWKERLWKKKEENSARNV